MLIKGISFIIYSFAHIYANALLGVVLGLFRNILKIITKKFGGLEICCIFVQQKSNEALLKNLKK